MLSSSFSNILHKQCSYYSSSQLSIYCATRLFSVQVFFTTFFIYFLKISVYIKIQVEIKKLLVTSKLTSSQTISNVICLIRFDLLDACD